MPLTKSETILRDTANRAIEAAQHALGKLSNLNIIYPNIKEAALKDEANSAALIKHETTVRGIITTAVSQNNEAIDKLKKFTEKNKRINNRVKIMFDNKIEILEQQITQLISHPPIVTNKEDDLAALTQFRKMEEIEQQMKNDVEQHEKYLNKIKDINFDPISKDDFNTWLEISNYLKNFANTLSSKLLKSYSGYSTIEKLRLELIELNGDLMSKHRKLKDNNENNFSEFERGYTESQNKETREFTDKITGKIASLLNDPTIERPEENGKQLEQEISKFVESHPLAYNIKILGADWKGRVDSNVHLRKAALDFDKRYNSIQHQVEDLKQAIAKFNDLELLMPNAVLPGLRLNLINFNKVESELQKMILDFATSTTISSMHQNNLIILQKEITQEKQAVEKKIERVVKVIKIEENLAAVEKVINEIKGRSIKTEADFESLAMEANKLINIKDQGSDELTIQRIDDVLKSVEKIISSTEKTKITGKVKVNADKPTPLDDSDSIDSSSAPFAPAPDGYSEISTRVKAALSENNLPGLIRLVNTAIATCTKVDKEDKASVIMEKLNQSRRVAYLILNGIDSLQLDNEGRNKLLNCNDRLITQTLVMIGSLPEKTKKDMYDKSKLVTLIKQETLEHKSENERRLREIANTQKKQASFSSHDEVRKPEHTEHRTETMKKLNQVLGLMGNISYLLNQDKATRLVANAIMLDVRNIDADMDAIKRYVDNSIIYGDMFSIALGLTKNQLSAISDVDAFAQHVRQQVKSKKQELEQQQQQKQQEQKQPAQQQPEQKQQQQQQQQKQQQGQQQQQQQEKKQNQPEQKQQQQKQQQQKQPEQKQQQQKQQQQKQPEQKQQQQQQQQKQPEQQQQEGKKEIMKKLNAFPALMNAISYLLTQDTSVGAPLASLITSQLEEVDADMKAISAYLRDNRKYRVHILPALNLTEETFSRMTNFDTFNRHIMNVSSFKQSPQKQQQQQQQQQEQKQQHTQSENKRKNMYIRDDKELFRNMLQLPEFVANLHRRSDCKALVNELGNLEADIAVLKKYVGENSERSNLLLEMLVADKNEFDGITDMASFKQAVENTVWFKVRVLKDTNLDRKQPIEKKKKTIKDDKNLFKRIRQLFEFEAKYHNTKFRYTGLLKELGDLEADINALRRYMEDHPDKETFLKVIGLSEDAFFKGVTSIEGLESLLEAKFADSTQTKPFEEVVSSASSSNSFQPQNMPPVRTKNILLSESEGKIVTLAQGYNKIFTETNLDKDEMIEFLVEAERAEIAELRDVNEFIDTLNLFPFQKGLVKNCILSSWDEGERSLSKNLDRQITTLDQVRRLMNDQINNKPGLLQLVNDHLSDIIIKLNHEADEANRNNLLVNLTHAQSKEDLERVLENVGVTREAIGRIPPVIVDQIINENQPANQVPREDEPRNEAAQQDQPQNARPIIDIDNIDHVALKALIRSQIDAFNRAMGRIEEEKKAEFLQEAVKVISQAQTPLDLDNSLRKLGLTADPKASQDIVKENREKIQAAREIKYQAILTGEGALTGEEFQDMEATSDELRKRDLSYKTILRGIELDLKSPGGAVRPNFAKHKKMDETLHKILMHLHQIIKDADNEPNSKKKEKMKDQANDFILRAKELMEKNGEILITGAYKHELDAPYGVKVLYSGNDKEDADAEIPKFASESESTTIEVNGKNGLPSGKQRLVNHKFESTCISTSEGVKAYGLLERHLKKIEGVSRPDGKPHKEIQSSKLTLTIPPAERDKIEKKSFGFFSNKEAELAAVKIAEGFINYLLENAPKDKDGSLVGSLSFNIGEDTPRKVVRAMVAICKLSKIDYTNAAIDIPKQELEKIANYRTTIQEQQMGVAPGTLATVPTRPLRLGGRH